MITLMCLHEEQAFLKLSPSKWVWRFFEWMEESLMVANKNPPKSDNFIIHNELNDRARDIQIHRSVQIVFYMDSLLKIISY